MLRSAREEAGLPVLLTVVGLPDDLEGFTRGLGAAAEYVSAAPLPVEPPGPLHDSDLVIVVVEPPLSEDARAVVSYLKRHSIEYAVALNRVNLSGRALEEALTDAAAFFGLSPHRLAPFLPVPSFVTQPGLLEKIVDLIPEKELALANRVPIFREVVVGRVIEQTARQNALLGAVTIIPGADMPVLTANQIKMVMDIAGAFGLALTWTRAKEVLAVVGGGFTFRAVARQLLDFVPVAGWMLKGAVAYAGTRAMGEVAVRYFAALEQTELRALPKEG